VVEPAPASFGVDHPARRSIGPADVTGYHHELVERCSGSGVAIDAVVLEDPVSMSDGLVRWLGHIGPALVVVGTHRRLGIARIVHGDRAATIARSAPGPVLAVELGWRR
jgi:nucleotide-binding universal stress UspA family protein